MPMGIGIGLSITLGEGGSDLYRLFANGEDGFLFANFGDLTRLFTTYQGPTQVANDADPVGLALEDGKWSKRTLAQQLAQAAELITNGTFDTDISGWTGSEPDATAIVKTWDTGRLKMARGSGGNAQGATQTIATVVGATYAVTFTASNASCAFRVDSGVVGTVVHGIGTATYYFVATATTAAPYFWPTASNSTVYLDNISLKRVTGNHALQSTGVQRPFYKPNSGKPYLIFDGSDDRLLTSLLPSSAMTLAAAVQGATANTQVIGAGASTTNQRVFLGIDTTSGRVCGGWGAQNSSVIVGGSDVRNTDGVAIMVADGTSVDLYWNGTQVYSAASSGSPSGSTSSFALGAWNNGGAAQGFWSGRVYGALALNRRASAAEIALINSKLRSTYQ